MFFDNGAMAFVITGVYRVHSCPGEFVERGRAHTAISLRIKGNSCVLSNGLEYEMKTGTVGFFPAGVDYVRTATESEEFIAVHLQAFGDSGRKIETIDGCNMLLPLFEELYEEWEKGGTVSRNRCMGLLYWIFEKLSQTSEKENREVPQVIACGVAYLQKNFRARDITVARLASMCNVSEVYFRRVYRGHFGQSPMETLLWLRFEYAKNLLISGYYPTKTIADMAGFSDVKYFRTAFKNRFGVTPTEFGVRVNGEKQLGKMKNARVATEA